MLRVILEGQTAIATKLDLVQERLAGKLDTHADNDSREFKALHDEIGKGLGGLRDRIVEVEAMADIVDGVNNATANHEQRLVDVEMKQMVRTASAKMLREERQSVAGWVQWVVTGLIAAIAALGAWVVHK